MFETRSVVRSPRRRTGTYGVATNTFNLKPVDLN